MSALQRHPFPVVAYFEKVVAVSFAFPEEVLRPMVSAGLEADTFEGLGFITVAMVWTRRLRPAGFPAFLGRDFFLAGYRIFVRMREASGRRLRGLQIIRSETDKASMVRLGNLMTRYRYRHVRVTVDENGPRTRVRTCRPDGAVSTEIVFGRGDSGAALPEGSPFRDWTAARRFAGPMPFTLSAQGDGSFVVVQGTRQHWEPQPVPVAEWQVSLFDEPPLRGVRPILANAFSVEGIPYRWERGRVLRPALAA